MKHLSRFGVILLGCILIFSSLAPAFADNDYSVTTEGDQVFEDLLSYYLWICMNAWGITISYDNFMEYTEEAGQQILDWVYDYLDATPSIYDISTWIAPWQASFDYWGNLQFNTSMLEDVQDFVDWLTGYQGFTDNTTGVINPVYTINGMYPLYNFNQWYSSNVYASQSYDASIDYANVYQFITYDPNLYYFYWMNASDRNVKTCVVSPASHGSSMYIIEAYTQPNTGSNRVERIGTTFSISNSNAFGVYYFNIEGDLFNHVRPVGYIPVMGTSNELTDFFANMKIVDSGDLKYICQVITLPTDNPDYTPGDSMVVIGDNPQYQVIEWDGTVTVNNLPAVVSTGSVQDPGLEEAYSPILALINYSADAMAAIIGIMYELPEEVIIPVYAVMGAVIVFGVIKLMREH